MRLPQSSPGGRHRVCDVTVAEEAERGLRRLVFRVGQGRWEQGQWTGESESEEAIVVLGAPVGSAWR